MQYHRSPLVKIENRNKFFCILVLHKRKISLLSIMTWTFPANTPRGFLIETTWKRSFPRLFNVESTWRILGLFQRHAKLNRFLKVNFVRSNHLRSTYTKLSNKTTSWTQGVNWTNMYVRLVRLLNVICTFNLRSAHKGSKMLVFWYICARTTCPLKNPHYNT